jgi:hypothetical protein
MRWVPICGLFAIASQRETMLKPLNAIRSIEVGAQLEKAARGEQSSTPTLFDVVMRTVDKAKFSYDSARISKFLDE